MTDTMTTTDWRDRPFLPLKIAASIAGLSASSLYRAQNEGQLEFRRLAGRTLVVTDSLKSFLGKAEPWSPSSQGQAARTKRRERAKPQVQWPELIWDARVHIAEEAGSAFSINLIDLGLSAACRLPDCVEDKHRACFAAQTSLLCSELRTLLIRREMEARGYVSDYDIGLQRDLQSSLSSADTIH